MREIALHILDVVENALRAQAGCIRIEVCADAPAGALRVCIADDGTGMTPDVLQRAAVAFCSGRTTRPFGFGLALLEQSVANAAGSLTIRSAPGQGTTVRFVYPLLHVNRPPMGDLAGTLAPVLICAPACAFVIRSLRSGCRALTLDTGSVVDRRCSAQALREITDSLHALFPPGFGDPQLSPEDLSHERRALREARQRAEEQRQHADSTSE